MSGVLQPVKRIYRCIIALSARQRYTNHTKNKILSRQFGNFSNGQGGAAALKMALEEAGGCEDYSKLYINAHGTSTPLNDACETKAIKTALGEEAARQCMVSSTKSMTGHMLGAAGAVEAIACVLAVKEGIVPPTIGYQEPDPECDLDYVPNQAREARWTWRCPPPWAFGGHNAYLAFRRV